MTSIYLSAKLQALFPPFDAKVNSTSPNDTLGDWNGHVFTLNRKRYLIFVNNKTYYAVILAGVLKKDLSKFSAFFLAHLLEQLTYDNLISPADYPLITAHYGQAQLARTNNDRKVLGTINEFIFMIKAYCERQLVTPLEVAALNHKINNSLTGAGRTGKHLYGKPINDMKDLIEQLKASAKED
ncbi:MAG: DUF6933 domain-containing protein [Adhaeribacter sp.]